MIIEALNIVDSNDQVIGENTRDEIHRLGQRHRSVHIFVFNSHGEIFLQKRSMQKDNDPGLWDTSVAGHVDSGEDYDQAALREVQEELGTSPQEPLQRLIKYPATPETGNEFCWIYHCEMNGPFQLDPDEIDEGRWLTITELANWMTREPQLFTYTLRLTCEQIIFNGKYKT